MNAIAIQVQQSFTAAVRPSQRVCEVAAMFGLGVDESRQIEVVPPTAVTLAPGKLLFVTGQSGGGKSTMLRLIGQQLEVREDVQLIRFDQRGGRDDHRPLVEALGSTLEDATRCLSLAGLSDAFVMLRKPGELSDGQRYRYALARAFDAVQDGDDRLVVVLADEFGSTLDRQTAKVIARNVRKWTKRHGVCFIAATTHDDLLEALEPDELFVLGR